MNRRKFAKSTLMAATMVSASTFSGFSSLIPPATRNFRKGISWGCIGTGKTVIEKFQAAKDAGFEGVEVLSHFDRNEVLKACEATGLVISGVCDSKHWKFLLCDPDPKVREEGVAALKVTLQDAAVYGAKTVILVPGVVNDTISYDECWERSAKEIKKVLPLAESLNVKIVLENVWNNFLLSPVETVTYLDQFDSQYIGLNIDCGNLLIYGWPEQWIKILGKRIFEVHIKEFSRKIAKTQGNDAGYNVKLMEGDVNWSAVMNALDQISYTGWTNLEQSGGNSAEELKDLYVRLIKIEAS